MRVIAGAALLTLLAACGTDTGESGSPGAAAWDRQSIAGTPAVDFPSVLAVDGDDLVVLMHSDDGVLQGSLSRDGGPFRAGEPLRTGVEYVGLGGVARLPDGDWVGLGSGGLAEVDGDDELEFAPFGLRSADGLDWQRVEVSGLAGPVELHGMASVAGGVVVVGVHRGAEDPSAGGFRAGAWFSADGVRFTEVALPGPLGGESSVGHLARVAGRLLAGGTADGRAALWTTSDGRTWARSEDPQVGAARTISGLAVDGGVVLASQGEEPDLLRSSDGGSTWETLPAPAGGGEGFAPVWSAAGRFLTIAGGSAEPFPEPAACYADLDGCAERPRAGLYASDDGVTWGRVDTSGLGEVDDVVGTRDGRTVVLTGDGDARAAYTWPAGTPLPEADEPALPATVELVTPAEGGEPAVGVTYHAPMHVHCGMDWFWFGGRTWRRTDDGPGLDSGAGDGPPAGWPLVGETLYGFATVDVEGTLAYTLENGEQIATYVRRDGAPGCD